MNKIDEFNYFNDLIPLYKNLLTLKQQEVIEKYFIYNLSLSEIAEILMISKAGVNDHLEHAKQNLLGYEDKLHILKKLRLLEKDIENLNITKEEKEKLIKDLYYGIWKLTR